MTVIINNPFNLWFDIPGYGGTYQASRLGDIRRVYRDGHTKVLSQFTKHNGKEKYRYRLYVNLSYNGKRKCCTVLSLMVKTFFGEVPKGKIPYHKNLSTWDNRVENIGFIDKKELGRLTGIKADRRKSVIKYDRDGNAVDAYRSAREAARQNHMSYQAVLDRCHNKVNKPYALDGFNYQFEKC